MMEPVSNVEMQWIAAHAAELEAQYSGEWIAIMGDTVVASGATMIEVATAARAAGYPNPFYEYIPDLREGDYPAPVMAVNDA